MAWPRPDALAKSGAVFLWRAIDSRSRFWQRSIERSRLQLPAPREHQCRRCIPPSGSGSCRAVDCGGSRYQDPAVETCGATQSQRMGQAFNLDRRFCPQDALDSGDFLFGPVQSYFLCPVLSSIAQLGSGRGESGVGDSAYLRAQVVASDRIYGSGSTRGRRGSGFHLARVGTCSPRLVRRLSCFSSMCYFPASSAERSSSTVFSKYPGWMEQSGLASHQYGRYNVSCEA